MIHEELIFFKYYIRDPISSSTWKFFFILFNLLNILSPNNPTCHLCHVPKFQNCICRLALFTTLPKTGWRLLMTLPSHTSIFTLGQWIWGLWKNQNTTITNNNKKKHLKELLILREVSLRARTQCSELHNWVFTDDVLWIPENLVVES